MKHKLTGLQPKKINIESGVFECGGVFYYINLEAMSFERVKRFYELIPVISYGKKYTDLLNFIHDLRMKMTTGDETMKQTYFEVAAELTNWDQYLIENGSNFMGSSIDDMLRFCALFCVTKDEDMTVVNDVIIEEKVANFKREMAMDSFFFLAASQVPRYKELLKKLLDETKRNGGNLIGKMIIPEN